MSYKRFLAMIAVATVVMFGLMYLNTYALDHVFYSQTRTWMAVVMGATMAFIMLAFMWSMYKNRRLNIAILLASVGAFAVALWLVRGQETVNDVSYMKAMIPHHSIAIMTSERAHIRDPRVRLLADRIEQRVVREDPAPLVMKKRRVLKEDGRYLIYYEFTEGPAGASKGRKGGEAS